MDDVQLNLVNEEPYAQREAGDPIPFPIGGVFGDTTSPTEAAEAALNSIEDALEQMAEIEHQHAETSAKIHKIFFDTDPDSPRAA